MSETPLKATLKSGTGYDAPWLTIDADNPTDLEQKLRGIIDSKVMETVAEAASLFQATTNVAPLTQAPPQQAYAQGSSFGGGDHGMNAPAQQEQAPSWATGQPQQPAAPQQSGGWGSAQQPQQQQQQGGNGQCQCGQPLEFKTTGSGKGVYRCPQWRWNNGNPTPNHDQAWA